MLAPARRRCCFQPQRSLAEQFKLLRVVDNQRSVAAGAAAADPSMQLS